MDVNNELLNTYRSIKVQPLDLIHLLEIFEEEFNHLDTDEEKKEYFYSTRENFNKEKVNINLSKTISVKRLLNLSF